MTVLQRLESWQTQSLKLTPQLREAIRLLELPTQELSAYVEQAVQENPLLSFEEYEAESVPAQSSEEESDPFSELASPDYDNLWTHSSGISPPSSPSHVFDQGDAASLIDRLPSKPLTFREHLLTQLNTDLRDPVEKMIGLCLLDGLDESGYLRADLKDLANTLGCSTNKVESTLKKMQRFDPIGIFGRDLAECLKLQLWDQGKLTPKLEKVLNHLSLLAEGKTDRLCHLAQTTPEELRQMIKLLKTLDPKPGLRFDLAPVVPLIPDVYVTHYLQTDEWIVTLNEASLPRLLVEQWCKAYLGKDQREGVLKKYIQNHFSHAHWLIRTLEQRAHTILAVSREIVKVQEAFFRYGIMHLKPLVLRDIAKSAEVHESTVSRVTAHKYMSTPRGTFELRYFFSQGLNSNRGEDDIATQSIKHRLKQIIQAEDKAKPYSDDELASIFAREGITIARRTIAKYREALDIPSSYKRCLKLA